MRNMLERGAVIAALMVIATGALAAAPVYKLRVDGLACPFCAYGIEKQLGAVEGVDTIEVDIANGAVILTMADGATLDQATAEKAVEAAGFSLGAFEPPAVGQVVAPEK